MNTFAEFKDDLYSLNLNSIEGKEVSFEQFRGKVLLIVNTASKCGFTNQYDGLEKLYQKYKDKNFLVLGFPSNDFAGQEPENNEGIVKFCKIKYGVTFPLFEKSSVKGQNKNPLYKLLTEKSDFNGEIGWNFVKFLVDKNGKLISRHTSLKSPEGLEKNIIKLLE